MAQCMNCGRSGFFLSIDDRGLCSKCGPIVTFDVQQRVRIINESQEIVNKTKSFGTKHRRIDVIIMQLKDLKIKYEDKGISAVEGDLSLGIQEAERARADFIDEEVKFIIDSVLAKSKLAETKASKLSPLKKGIEKIREMSSIGESRDFKEDEKQLWGIVHEIELNHYLEEAKKAEFKGNRKKALDQYQEALYFLMNDDIPDELQKNNMDNIKAKIDQLKIE